MANYIVLMDLSSFDLQCSHQLSDRPWQANDIIFKSRQIGPGRPILDERTGVVKSSQIQICPGRQIIHHGRKLCGTGTPPGHSIDAPTRAGAVAPTIHFGLVTDGGPPSSCHHQNPGLGVHRLTDGAEGWSNPPPTAPHLSSSQPAWGSGSV